MIHHIKCLFKVVGVVPMILLACTLTLLQLFFVVIPLSLLGMSGCYTGNLPDAVANNIMDWYRNL